MLLDHRVAALAEGRVIERHSVPAGEPELRTLHLHAMEEVGGLEQRLGRDAAAVEAGPAQSVALDDRHLHPELGGADRAHVAHPTPQDEQIEMLLFGHRSPDQVAEPAGTGRSSERPSTAVKRRRQSSGTGIGLARS